MYGATLLELRRMMVQDPRAGWTLLYLAARAETECGDAAAEKRLAWQTVRLPGDQSTRLLCDTARYLLCDAGGRGTKAGGRAAETPRADGFHFVAAAMDAVWTGDPALRETVLSTIWTLDFRLINWLFGHLLKILRFTGLHVMAGRLQKLWALWEYRLRAEAETVVYARSFFENIGHATIRLAIEIAEGRDLLPSKTRFAIAAASPHNPTLSAEIARGLALLSPAELRSRRKVYEPQPIGSAAYRLSTGEVLTLGKFVSRCLDEHFRQSDLPLVSLDPALVRRAAGDLRSVGVDPGRKIVTLHVREGHFDPKSLRITELRNADIRSYLPAIRMLVDLGYQVVRLGDPTMTQLGKFDGFFDYPFSPVKSDYLDLYLASTCDFHIGTSSGMSHIPLLFDRPVVYTNWMPYGEHIYSRKSIILMKKLHGPDGETVRPAQAEAEHENMYDALYFRLKGLTVVDNSSAEIVRAVEEMIALVASRDRPARLEPRFAS